jgi:hypothetical protein
MHSSLHASGLKGRGVFRGRGTAPFKASNEIEPAFWICAKPGLENTAGSTETMATRSFSWWCVRTGMIQRGRRPDGPPRRCRTWENSTERPL